MSSPAGSLRQEFPRALRIVWLVLGLVSGVLVVAPHVLSPEFLFEIFPICAAKAAGSTCVFCGMTTAFVSIGRHDWAGAQAANAGAIPLYGLLLMNFIGAGTYTMMRVIRHANP
jgi:hypothetical protein